MARTGRDPLEPDRADVRVARGGAWTITTWIVVVNVVIFALGHLVFPQRVGILDTVPPRQVVVPSPVDAALWFSFADAVQRFQVWRFVTFQFVHANVLHIAGNLFGLVALGPVVEDFLGRRRYLAYYLLCGAVGPIAFMLLGAFGSGGMTPDATLVGASAGVFGVLVGAGVVAPDAWVQLIFPPTPVRLRTAAILMLCVAVYTVFAYGGTGANNAGGQAAHLGGAVVGYLLIRRPDALDWAERIGPPARRRVA